MAESTMKAVVFHQHGGPEQLRFEEVEPPRIQPDEVLVRVKACALNHLDIWIRQGIPAYQIPLPHISGCDVAGVVVDATGSSVVTGDSDGTTRVWETAPGRAVATAGGYSAAVVTLEFSPRGDRVVTDDENGRARR